MEGYKVGLFAEEPKKEEKPKAEPKKKKEAPKDK